MVLRTAASTSTARLRPAATWILTMWIGRPSTSRYCESSGRRSNSPSLRRTNCTTSLIFIFRRTAVSPKMVLMSSRPRPRTSSRFCSSGGQRPSMKSGPSRTKSTASSATRPWPREISSRPSSLLPRPDSPMISTPMPRMSRNTPCMVTRGAEMRDRYRRRWSITAADDTGVVNSGVDERVQRSSRSGGGSMPSATTRKGGSSRISSPIWRLRISSSSRW
ncbi:hypothetical protein D9M72_511820 [compost metagenome]